MPAEYAEDKEATLNDWVQGTAAIPDDGSPGRLCPGKVERFNASVHQQTQQDAEENACHQVRKAFRCGWV